MFHGGLGSTEPLPDHGTVKGISRNRVEKRLCVTWQMFVIQVENISRNFS